MVGSVSAIVALVFALFGAPSVDASATQHDPDLSSAAEAAQGTIAVAPSTDLADGQMIEVSGAGWPAGALLVLGQCEPTIDNCFTNGKPVHVEGDGTFDAQPFSVRVTIDESDGPAVDCRIDACSIIAYDVSRDVYTSSPIGFDPSAPTLPPATLQVEPSTGVRDGDGLHLTGRYFVPNRSLEAVLCAPAPVTHDDCDAIPQDEILSDLHGDIDTYLAGVASFRTGNGREVDCRVAACEVAVFRFFFRGTFLEGSPLATTQLSFDPDAPLRPLPSATAAPTAELADGQRVRVRGQGFLLHEPVLILQCPASVADLHPFAVVHCNYGGHIYADPVAGGEIDATIEVRRRFEGVSGVQIPRRVVDCAAEPCVLVVIDFRGDEGAMIPLAFASNAQIPGDPLPATAIAGVQPHFTG